MFDEFDKGDHVVVMDDWNGGHLIGKHGLVHDIADDPHDDEPILVQLHNVQYADSLLWFPEHALKRCEEIEAEEQAAVQSIRDTHLRRTVRDGVCLQCGSAVLDGEHLRTDLPPCGTEALGGSSNATRTEAQPRH